MANREAIRELQTRLAHRLRTARDEGLSVSWLAVRCAGMNYLLPLAQSGEIFPITAVQPVPYAQPWFLGVVNLRGGLFGVVNIAQYVASETGQVAGGGAQRKPGAAPLVVTLNAALDVNCALLVDELAGLRNPQVFSAALPRDPQAPPYYGNRFTDAGGQSWQEINIQTLSQHPRFLSITAQAHP
ncbi:MAG: chemotaxis protein CheW [Rhodoferax sp.]|nr:chemotaxis protein CheW [Rhodoferax sp.]MBP9929087.1 chemotaxis protein CheW [Rhodoferax sp.]HQX60481.1 chemotaxis protein CheW [Burkholderiaceae bacterium]HQZ05108.1 chemotaxis protein CheW [Burkholderiaceae bacterium]HRA61486.1 chemotaxis protein CheW [Burkholderiaceae bacterium]